jgi:predicted signal transduction protein with EAL and GGDEF domain
MPPEISALKVAREVESALSEAYIIHSSQVEIGASIGVAFYPEHGATLATLLRAADHAMYEAKNKGRRRVQLYSDDLEIRIAGKAETERDLKRALLHDELFLEFQSQVDFASGRVVGAEALVRWAHPDGTIWQPGAFLPVAEESGVIVELGRWVTGKVCESVAHIQSIGLDHRIAINISRRELKQPGFFGNLLDMMGQHGVDPQLIEIELSETLFMQLDDEILGKLRELRQVGTRIVIDDFGTGLSNLARLKDLPIDRVKIDRSLVRDIARSEEARTICAAVVALVCGLGLEIVVEGIESEEQIEMLRVMGCTIFQGFHLSRPVEESRFFERLGAGPTARSA